MKTDPQEIQKLEKRLRVRAWAGGPLGGFRISWELLNSLVQDARTLEKVERQRWPRKRGPQ